jgi:hypothetical protein
VTTPISPNTVTVDRTVEAAVVAEFNAALARPWEAGEEERTLRINHDLGNNQRSVARLASYLVGVYKRAGWECGSVYEVGRSSREIVFYRPAASVTEAMA